MFSINPLEAVEWIKTLTDRKKWNRFPGRGSDYFWREYPEEGFSAEVSESGEPIRTDDQVIRDYEAKVRRNEHLIAEESGFDSSEVACDWADKIVSSRAYPESSPYGPAGGAPPV